MKTLFLVKIRIIEFQSYSENDFEQKLGILTKVIKKFLNFENFENFGKMRQFLVRQSFTKDCTVLSLAAKLAGTEKSLKLWPL